MDQIKPYIDAYNSAQTKYLSLLNSARKHNLKIEQQDFDNIKTALQYTVNSAELMKNEAKKILDVDCSLLEDARKNYERALDSSVYEENCIIKATTSPQKTLKSMGSRKNECLRVEAETRAIYDNALQSYNNALADLDWWTNSKPNEFNKNIPIPRGASFDAFSAFLHSQGSGYKSRHIKRKSKRRKNKKTSKRSKKKKIYK